MPKLRMTTKADGRLERWSRPLRNAFNDYVYVAKDVGVYIKTHPFKFSIMCVAASALAVLWVKNPDINEYREEILCYSNEISQCSEQTRNPDAHKYITNLINMHCTGLLQHVNLGFLTLVLKRPNYRDCLSYPQRCSYLQPKWWEYHNRILDVGFWGQWWALKKRMIDFDINGNDLAGYVP